MNLLAPAERDSFFGLLPGAEFAAFLASLVEQELAMLWGHLSPEDWGAIMARREALAASTAAPEPGSLARDQQGRPKQEQRKPPSLHQRVRRPASVASAASLDELLTEPSGWDGRVHRGSMDAPPLPSEPASAVPPDAQWVPPSWWSRPGVIYERQMHREHSAPAGEPPGGRRKSLSLLVNRLVPAPEDSPLAPPELPVPMREYAVELHFAKAPREPPPCRDCHIWTNYHMYGP